MINSLIMFLEASAASCNVSDLAKVTGPAGTDIKINDRRYICTH